MGKGDIFERNMVFFSWKSNENIEKWTKVM